MSTLTGHQDDTAPSPQLSGIADRFVAARRAGAALEGFPGTVPDDLVTAYRVQDLAIAQWPDRVIGWKVGYIAPERRDASGDERLLGLGRRLARRQDGKAVCPGQGAGLRIDLQPHHDVRHARIAQVQRMGPALAAVTDHGYALAANDRKVAVAVMEDGKRIR